MKQWLYLMVCLLIVSSISAQQTPNVKQNQFGFFIGTGRTSYKDKSYVGRLGFDAGMAFIRQNKKRNCRLEFDFSASRWNFKSKKSYQSYNPLSDTFLVSYRKAWFFDMAIKSNIKLYKGDKFRLYLSAGLTLGSFINSHRRIVEYLTSTNAQVSSGEWIEIKPFTYAVIGVEYGLINEIPLKKNWILSIDLLILSKVTFEYEASYPFKFQQLRIGIRKPFGLY